MDTPSYNRSILGLSYGFTHDGGRSRFNRTVNTHSTRKYVSKTKHADLQDNSRMEPSPQPEHRSLHPSLGNLDELQPIGNCPNDELSRLRSILQHVILLRREVEELRWSNQRLESTCEILAKAAYENDHNSPFDNPAIGPILLLSLRQKRVFLMLANGKTPKDIAFELNCSIKTIQHHWDKIKHALNITSYVDATKLAHQTGLLRPNRKV